MVGEKIRGNVEIENVCKTFVSPDEERTSVLENVNLHVEGGEFVSIIGPSGCGKSTLLYCIAGLQKPEEGNIFMDGQLVKEPSYERGLVFQNPQLFKWMNVERNIAFGLKARKVYKKRKADVSQYIQMIGLEGFEKNYPHQLSGGMCQRVSLARTLINHPKILLLDEPFGALDAFTRNTMQEQIRNIWKNQNMTMIMVTHDIDEAIFLSSQIVVMTPRPAKIKAIIKNPYQGTREENEGFQKLRREILNTLEF